MEDTIVKIATANTTLTEERRERTSLRLLLNILTEVTQEWIKMAVCLAKMDKLKFLEFRKILSRILREKQIRVSGYRKMLENQWHTLKIS